MEITTSSEGTVTVLEIKGDLTFGAGEQQFSEQIQSLLEDGNRLILVDVERVGFVDSSGLGALIRSQTSCSQVSGRLALIGVGQQLRSLLAIARLTEVLEIFDSRDEALQSLAS